MRTAHKAVLIHILAAALQVVTHKADTLHIITKATLPPEPAEQEHIIMDIEDLMVDPVLLLLLIIIKRGTDAV